MQMASIITITIILIYHATIISCGSTRATQFPIGGLFTKYTEPTSAKAFQNILDRKSAAYYGRLIYSQEPDIYSTALQVCKNTSDDKGIVALIDARPSDGICDTTCLLANRLKIAHLSLGWEQPDKPSDDSLYTISYYPPLEFISRAYAALIKHLEWDSFSIMYEDDGTFIRLQELINTWPSTHDPIHYVKLDPKGDNREAFKNIFKVERMTYHILDCDVRNIRYYMNQIIQVENSTQYQSFILTPLDAYTVDLSGIPELIANVSTLHLTTLNDIRWKDIGMGTDMRVETALVADALNHLEISIRTMQMDMAEESNMEIEDPPPLCFSNVKAEYDKAAWSAGEQLRDSLLKTKVKGFTGDIEFDENGRRTNFALHYSKLNNESKFVYAGRWESITDNITVEDSDTDERGLQSGPTLRVVAKRTKPYLDVVNVNGVLEYEGYSVDLVRAIFDHMRTKQQIDRNFEFYTCESHGNPIEGTKKWDGLIGELMEHNADLAVCDITITSERNNVVDFSVPFMSLGISMLFKEPDPEEPDMFSFIKPLSLDVWLYLATAYIIVSFILLICARMSQGDWVNPHPCNRNPENYENIWNLYNCMWLTMGAIMTQGCDILPRAGGSRWITGMWWFFALIVTSSYTANMSTFISNDRRETDIKDVKALSEQTKVSYGVMENAATYKFFEKSNDTVYQKIWSVMKSAKPTVFTSSNEEGRDRVIRSKGKYAFFMESTTIEYYKNRNCQLKMVGNKLDAKEYGIAMPKKFPYRRFIDNAILYLQESGKLDALKKKWWEEQDIVEPCKEKENEDDSLQMKNTSGIFLVLGFGGILGLLVAVVDFLLHAHRICVKEKVTFKEAVISEWKVSFNVRTVRRPVAPLRSAVPSVENSPTKDRSRSRSRAVSVLKAATSFINFDEIY